MQKEDTSPIVPARRVKREWVRIQEINNPPSQLFDTAAEYASDELPEWFAPLQSIVEDTTFTSMDIVLGKGRVRYLITLPEEG